MKITGIRVLEIEASPRGNWILVEVRTDAGVTGIGEASQSGNDRLVKESLLQLGERLAGADPTQPEVIWESLARSGDIFAGAGRVAATAVSAIDQALWDIAGKGARGAGLAPARRQAARAGAALRQPQPRNPGPFGRGVCARRKGRGRGRLSRRQVHPVRRDQARPARPRRSGRGPRSRCRTHSRLPGSSRSRGRSARRLPLPLQPRAGAQGGGKGARPRPLLVRGTAAAGPGSERCARCARPPG